MTATKERAEKKFFEKYTSVIEKDKFPILFTIANDPVIQSALYRGKQPNLKTVKRLFEDRGITLPSKIDPDPDEECEAELKITRDNKKIEEKILSAVNSLQKKFDILFDQLQSTIEFAVPSDSLSHLTKDEKIKHAQKMQANHIAAIEFKKSFRVALDEMVSETIDDFLNRMLAEGLIIIDEFVGDWFVRKYTSSNDNLIVDKKYKIIVVDSNFFDVSTPLTKKIKEHKEATLSVLGGDPIVLIIIQSSAPTDSQPIDYIDGRKFASIQFYIIKDDLFSQFRFKLKRERDTFVWNEGDIPIVSHPSFRKYYYNCIKDAYAHLYYTLKTGEDSTHDELFNHHYRQLFVDYD